MVFVGVDGLAGLPGATAVLIGLLIGLTGFLGAGNGRLLSKGNAAKGRR